MDSKDLIKLAKLFDNFIELDSSRVRIQDIVAVQKCSEGGINVVTPHGIFPDSTDYDAFNTRIKDTLELLKDRVVEEAKITPVNALSNARASESAAPEQTERKIVPLQTPAEASARQTTIAIGVQGAQGTLFTDPTMLLGDRADLLVLDPTGQMVLGRAGEGSAIKGDKVSGFILSSGKYTLSFTDYSHKEAKISYTVVKKPTV